jgi:predicted regulator of Ras-like GTPase activity (Roadblock/LC7/MglB family)
MATNISELKNIAGFIAACVVDSESGLMLASEGGNAKFDIEAAGAANTEVVRAKNAAMAALGLEDHIEDILITLGTQLHLIRPLASNPSLFVYVALDRKNANLGMARMTVKNVEGKLKV